MSLYLCNYKNVTQSVRLQRTSANFALAILSSFRAPTKSFGVFEKRACLNMSQVCLHLQTLSVSHLFSVCFVFHQVHLPIAPFPNDPDESITIHHSSKSFITRPDTLKRYRTLRPRMLTGFSPTSSCEGDANTRNLMEGQKLPASSAPAMRFRKRRKSAALDSFFVTRQLVAHRRR